MSRSRVFTGISPGIPAKGGDGNYTLLVRGYDLAGNVGTSPQITVYR
jgi:hypothetical protein